MNTVSKGSNVMMSYWRDPNTILPADCKDLIITVSKDGHIQTRIASDFLDVGVRTKAKPAMSGSGYGNHSL